MPLFSRRLKVPATAPDAAFPYWDQHTADEFRALVRTSFAEAGTEVTVHADHVVDAGGAQYGLANLAAACHNDDRGRKAWREIVPRHVRTIVAAVGEQSPFDVLDDAEILRSTYCRVMPSTDVLPTMTYVREIAPQLSVAFNLDLPERVAYFTDELVARFGFDALRASGEANLRTVAIDDRKHLARDGGHIEVFLGESMFVASLVLVLADVLAGNGIAFDPDVGVLVAMPHRHQLDLHVPRDVSVLPSLQMLAGFAAAGYRDSAGPVSSSVYWWRPHALERVASVDGDEIRIDVGPELADVLNRLAAD